LRDFDPVALLPAHAHVIVARKTMPAATLKDLITWLGANPDKASQGTSGLGAASQLAGILFQKQTGTRFEFVSYRGTAMPDLIAGHIDLMIDTAANALPQVRAGTIKAYAVTSKNRLPTAPDIPTVDEAGLPGFYMSLWNGFWVPKGTPRAVIAKLNVATVDVLNDPAVRQRASDLGLEIFPREQETPEALAAFHRSEIKKWWPIVKAAKIKAE
jgi:tripartite-type tricarboxylate transporter receptor subunit TctC